MITATMEQTLLITYLLFKKNRRDSDRSNQIICMYSNEYRCTTPVANQVGISTFSVKILLK